MATPLAQITVGINIESSVQKEIKQMSEEAVKNTVGQVTSKVTDIQGKIGRVEGQIRNLPNNIPIVPEVRGKVNDAVNKVLAPASKYKELVEKGVSVNLPGNITLGLKPVLPGLPPGIADMQDKMSKAMSQITNVQLPDVPNINDLVKFPSMPALPDLPDVSMNLTGVPDLRKTIKKLKGKMVQKQQKLVRNQVQKLNNALAGSAIANNIFLV